MDDTPTLEAERVALEDARAAVETTKDRLRNIEANGADALSNEYINSVVDGAIDRMQHELVTFGRIDDEQPWRIGLYGIADEQRNQLVVDWRTPFAAGFYQASLDDPSGLTRRVSYVGCIDELMIEEFATGQVTGSSPLFAELSRHRGEHMRAAVATLQGEQDELVRRASTDRLVIRGGPGTGKTVVGLHRAAWLVYNDTRVFADRILVLGPSDRFLRFVSTVLPTLGEARILQSTSERLIGVSTPSAHDPRWVEILDRFEASLPAPTPTRIGRVSLDEEELASIIDRVIERKLPWKSKRDQFISAIARRCDVSRPEASKAATKLFPTATTNSVWKKLRRQAVLESLDAPPDLIDAWLAEKPREAGALFDEVRARFEGVPAKYSHVIVDEAQDLSLLELRMVLRRAEGLTMVGDDAQRSAPHALGLERSAELAGAEIATMATAYRMSREIADWLNAHAVRHDIPAVTLEGIRPTGQDVWTSADVDDAAAQLRSRWPNVAVIVPGEVWGHKGVEYDAVVVDADDMTAAEVYLAASRAAHELVIVTK